MSTNTFMSQWKKCFTATQQQKTEFMGKYFYQRTR